MIGCAVVYVLYIAAINLGSEVLFLFASSVIGANAGIFWLKSSEWIALEAQRSSDGSSSEGKITGAFFGVFYFQVNAFLVVVVLSYERQGILGCSIALCILQFQAASVVLLIWCMCGLTGVGLLLTLFVPSVEPAALSSSPVVSVKEKTLQLVRASSQVSVALLVPLFLLQSAQVLFNKQFSLSVSRSLISLLSSKVCFSYQLLPRLIQDSTSAAIFPTANVAAFFVYWAGSIVVSFSYGHLFDRFGWKVVLAVRDCFFLPLLPLNLCCKCVAVVELLCIASSLCLMLLNKQMPSPYLWMIVGFLRGVSDPGTNALVLATITQRFGSSLFGLYRGLYCLGFFVLGLATALSSPFVLLGSLVFFLISGVPCFFMSFRFPVANVNT